MIDIQTILRHKNLSTTERFIRRIESVRPALQVLPKVKNHLRFTLLAAPRGRIQNSIDYLRRKND